jgi:hypothetical protein
MENTDKKEAISSMGDDNTLSGAENKIKSITTHEEGYIFDRNGNLINHTISDSKSNINPPTHFIENNIFTHNHPSGVCTPSLTDVVSIVKHNGYELRVVVTDDRFISLTRPEGGWDNEMVTAMQKARLNSQSLNIRADIIKRKSIEYQNGDILGAEQKRKYFIENTMNDWLKENAKNYGAVFKEGRL